MNANLFHILETGVTDARATAIEVAYLPGLRMRRGLANTRTDNIASGRIQRFELRRPGPKGILP